MMNARQTMIAAVALLGVCALVAGCGSESTPLGSEAPLLPPQNVVVSQNALGEVLISWDANGQSGLRGYNVYRNDPTESSIAKLTQSPISETFYWDHVSDWGARFEYMVTSVGTKGNESAFAVVEIELERPSETARKRFQQ